MALDGAQSRPGWRTHASSASSTTTAPSLSMPPTPPTADPHQPATPRDHGFPVLHLHADRRTRGGQQGSGAVSAPDSRTLRRHVEIRSRIEYGRVLRSSVRLDGRAACQSPTQAWEVLQLGNCGSPIETDAGWLVLTHGVGPMRTYRIGAILLDLEDPTRILGQLAQPLLSPAA